jgi:ribonuclease HIII
MHTVLVEQADVAGFTEKMCGAHQPPSNKYEYARIRVSGTLIIVYKSGKIVFSQTPEDDLKARVISYLISTDGRDGITIGADEAGKGEKAGPLVVSAFMLRTPEERALARFYGAMDSKELSIQQITSIYTHLKHFNGNSMRMMPPGEFNKRFNNNLNILLTELYKSALTPLLEKVNGYDCKVFIDKYGGAAHDRELKFFIKQNAPQAEIIITNKAERYTSVACASICAKHEYENWILSHSEKRGIALKDVSRKDILNIEDRADLFKLSYIK